MPYKVMAEGYLHGTYNEEEEAIGVAKSLADSAPGYMFEVIQEAEATLYCFCKSRDILRAELRQGDLILPIRLSSIGNLVIPASFDGRIVRE